MEQYRQALIEKIAELQEIDSPMARTRIVILLKLLGELSDIE